MGVEHPRYQRVVGFADPRSAGTLGGHVAQRRPFVNRKGRQSWATELHAAVEGELLASVVGEDGEDDVLGRAPVMEFAHELETNGFGDFHEGEASADQVGVFRGAHAPRQGVGSAAHAGVGVRGLNEITNFDELLTGNLMADARRHAVNGRVVSHAGMLLEGHLQVPQRLHLVHERNEFRVVLGVEKMVFEHGKLVGVR